MAYSGSINLSGVSALQVFQRTSRTEGFFGVGTASVPVTINPTVPITNLKYQVRDFNNPTTILVPYTTIGSGFSVGSQIVNLPIPAYNVTATWYLIDLIADSDLTSVVTTPQCGVGELIAVSGQSLAMDMFSGLANDGSTVSPGSLGLTINNFGVVFGQAWNSTPIQSSAATWQLPVNNSTPGNINNFNSTFVINYLNLMISTYNVPCGFVGYAVGSQDIRSFLPPPGAIVNGSVLIAGDPNWMAGSFLVGGNPWTAASCYYTQLTTILSAAGGVFGNFIWCQGHRNAVNGSTQAQYVTYLTAFMGYMVSNYFSLTFNRIIGTIPSIRDTYTSTANIETIRQAGLQYTQADTLSALVDGIDAALHTDLVHPSQLGNIKLSNAFFRATAYKIGTLTQPARGPIIVSGTRTSATDIRLNIQQTGGTALIGTGDLTTQFKAFYSGSFTTPITINSVSIVSSTFILITIASGTPLSQVIDIWYRYPGDTNATISPTIYDNNLDSSTPSINYGRQLALPNAARTVDILHAPLTISAINLKYLNIGSGSALGYA